MCYEYNRVVNCSKVFINIELRELSTGIATTLAARVESLHCCSCEVQLQGGHRANRLILEGWIEGNKMSVWSS